MKIYRERLKLQTKGAFDVIDVTADVEKALVNSGIEEGYALVYSRHTTCGVMVNERETGLLGDLERVLGRLVPEGDYYKHDDWEIRTENMHPDETPNAHAHLRQLIGGRPSEYVPVCDAALMLGEWQRIMILELDQAKDREILIQVCGA
jgi:secondary thiamine-phosphate synthase enzyme